MRFRAGSDQAPSVSSAKASVYCEAAKPRAKLTQLDAINIYVQKTSIPATTIAREYRVSEKAIRDIWTGRTWTKETWHLDPSRVIQSKQAGRPKGSRDSRPRQKRRDEAKLRYSTKTGPVAFAHANDKADSRGPAKHPLHIGRFPISLDEQLHQWDAGVWCRPIHPDPFKDDWKHVTKGDGILHHSQGVDP